MNNWEDYRRPDGTLDLVRCFEDSHNVKQHQYPIGYTLKSITFLKSVEKIHPIKSRQVAALALAQAWEIHYEND